MTREIESVVILLKTFDSETFLSDIYFCSSYCQADTDTDREKREENKKERKE